MMRNYTYFLLTLSSASVLLGLGKICNRDDDAKYGYSQCSAKTNTR